MTKEEYLKLIDEVNENGKFKADWVSLSGHKTPEWYYKGKLGIFIHWGIYSVPGFGNEWYSRGMYCKDCREYDHHIAKYGTQDKFGYKDFIPMFTAEKFNAEEWAELFSKAGAKFVMPVCEHHDGFAMYATDFNKWNAFDMGPHHNVAGEIKEAVEKRDITFCASTHRAEHYWFMNGGRDYDSDVNDDTYRDFYGPAVSGIGDDTANIYSQGASVEWMEDWMVRTCELIDRYRPKILYFDWWIQNVTFKPYLKKIAAYYYNRAYEWGSEVTINYKHHAFPRGVATFDVERGALTDISPVPWQTDTAIGKHSWGYVKDNEFKSSRQVICDLVDIVSKNGMLLINIGPRPDGTITEEETQVLLDMGSWLRINGEGIYGTTPWMRFGEGEVNNTAGFFKDNDEKAFTEKDFRFTYKDCCIYAFQMRPKGRSVTIKSLAYKKADDIVIGEITILGDDEIEKCERDENGLHITLKNEPLTDLPVCFRIEMI